MMIDYTASDITHHQTTHLSFGFMGEPSGHPKFPAKCSELAATPLMRNSIGACTLVFSLDSSVLENFQVYCTKSFKSLVDILTTLE